MKTNRFIFFALSCTLTTCSIKPGKYSSTSVPPPPAYADSDHWAALPSKKDNADRTPDLNLFDMQASASADVFFLHPTTFLKKSSAWNAQIGDAKLNEITDESTILHQASCFNGAGRVFAPRYRQAHYYCFFAEDKASAKAALDLAYEDVRSAFDYYLKNYNNGRPIIIAAHSQGALHGIRLVKEFFDGKPLQNQLVAAYLIGWPLPKNVFSAIPLCRSAEQTGCFCSWRSFRHGHTPKGLLLGDSIAICNPLTWTVDKTPAPKSLNEGSVLKKYEKIYPQIADAQVENGILWVHKPRFPGSIFFTRKNYHIADVNLFYLNLRKNAVVRAQAFAAKKKAKTG